LLGLDSLLTLPELMVSNLLGVNTDYPASLIMLETLELLLLDIFWAKIEALFPTRFTLFYNLFACGMDVFLLFLAMLCLAVVWNNDSSNLRSWFILKYWSCGILDFLASILGDNLYEWNMFYPIVFGR